MVGTVTSYSNARLAVFVDLVSGLLPPHRSGVLPIARPIAPAAGDARAEDGRAADGSSRSKRLGANRRDAESAQRRDRRKSKVLVSCRSEPPAATDQGTETAIWVSRERQAGRPLGAGKKTGADEGTRTPTPFGTGT